MAWKEDKKTWEEEKRQRVTHLLQKFGSVH